MAQGYVAPVSGEVVLQSDQAVGEGVEQGVGGWGIGGVPQVDGIDDAAAEQGSPESISGVEGEVA